MANTPVMLSFASVCFSRVPEWWHRIDCDRGEITLSAAVEKPPQKS
jgi:hypothetical protein